ncbi:MAG: GldG family protein [Oscillospiraceae bacterium]|nr:GldG family protein [Oscillospiraceae bacterium]
MMKINKKKLKYASISTLFIAITVVMVVLVNVLVGIVSDRFSLQLDLSMDSGYTLSEETAEYLKNVDEDVTIYVLKHKNLVEASEDGVRLSENLARYNTLSGGHIKHEFIDPNVQVTFYDRFPNATKAEDALLVVASEKRYIMVPESDLKMQVGTDEEQPNKQQAIYQIESAINSALLHVLSDQVTRVAVITGHNEMDLPGMTNIFNGNGIEAVSVNLLTQDIPEDVNHLLVAGPSTDFAASEISKIDAFLSQDEHNLFLFWNPQVSRLEALDRYLTEWGLRFESMIVMDEQYTLGIDGDNSGVFAIPTQNDLITMPPRNSQQYLVSITSHPLSLLWDEENDRKVTSLAETNRDTSFAKVIDDSLSLAAARAAGDIAGPFSVAAVSETMVSPTSGRKPSRVFAIGTTYFAREDVLSASFTLNNTFLNELVSYGSPSSETMEVAPSIVKGSYDLNLRAATVNILFWVLVVILPLLILAAGIFMFIKRRHR